jgi:hypothetical protein
MGAAARPADFSASARVGEILFRDPGPVVLLDDDCLAERLFDAVSERGLRASAFAGL